MFLFSDIQKVNDKFGMIKLVSLELITQFKTFNSTGIIKICFVFWNKKH